jgi:lipoprotein-releasing system permease protein
MRLLLIELSIALRYLRAKKREAFISIISILSLLGITLGVAALIVVMAVMNGYRIELTEKLKGFNSDIVITGDDYKLKRYVNIINKIKRIPEIKTIAPVVNEQSLLIYNQNSVGVMIKGIKNSDMTKYIFLLGKKKKMKRANGIIMGGILARSMHIKVGDSIQLVSPKFKKSFIGKPVPKMEEFYVEGIFKSGLSEYDGAYVIMGLEQSQKFFELNQGISRVEVFLSQTDDTRKITSLIASTLDHQYRVIDWQTMNYSIFNALKTERVVMFVILAFIILVAAFNIISSLVMLVMDKTREIAILRTIGFSRWSIMRIFLITGMMLGIAGTFLGIISGIAFAYNINDIKEFLSSITGTNLFDPIIYYLDALPSKVDRNDVRGIAILSLVISLFSALYPAYKASKLLPVEGLKND